MGEYAKQRLLSQGKDHPQRYERRHQRSQPGPKPKGLTDLTQKDTEKEQFNQRQAYRKQ